MQFKRIDNGDTVILEPIFTVKDLSTQLGVWPTTVRTWLQMGWLDSYQDKEGYQISYSAFSKFLKKYGERLRSLPTTDIDKLDLIRPQDITERERRAAQAQHEFEARKKRFLAYAEWVQETYAERKKLIGDGWTLQQLLALPDETLAAKSGIPIPDGALEAVAHTKSADHSYAQEWGATPDEIKKTLLTRCISRELGPTQAFYDRVRQG